MAKLRALRQGELPRDLLLILIDSFPKCQCHDSSFDKIPWIEMIASRRVDAESVGPSHGESRREKKKVNKQ
jgi:hypothetical protein